MKDPNFEISDNNTKFTTNFKRQYLELAANNTSHFGWHNMKFYIHFHGEALRLAKASFEAKNKK